MASEANAGKSAVGSKVTPSYQRPLPVVDEVSRFFWTSGADGRLRVLRCDACRAWVHPPQPVCFRCHNQTLSPQATAGQGRIYSFTINVQPWGVGLPVPYVIAIVTLDEDPGIQIMTNIVGVDPASVAIGQRVRVIFQQDEDVWLPSFTPID
ncbi:MAG: OB-fold domain-containing protein [Sphingobium sp.]